MKIAFIIGHHQNAKGFKSDYFNLTEWDFYRGLEPKLEHIGDVYLHDHRIDGYTNRCKDIAKRIGAGYDIVFALHFNSFNKLANGCEAFYWNTNEKGFEIAKKFVDSYCNSTGARPRGAKPYNSPIERGAGEVCYPRATAILLEPFFGDNENDCKLYDPQKFLDAINDSFK